MDSTDDVSEVLSSRRARITPEQAGLPSYGTRRVPGLRREEVASLAGVSVEYYKRLERGNLSGVSDLVLEGLANALALDEAERAHLFDLARAAGPVAPRRRRSTHRGVRANVQRILDALDTPAVARAAYGDYVAANALGRALYAPCLTVPSSPLTAPDSPSWTRPPPTASTRSTRPASRSTPPTTAGSVLRWNRPDADAEPVTSGRHITAGEHAAAPNAATDQRRSARQRRR